MDYKNTEKYVKYMLKLWHPWKKRSDFAINTTLGHPAKTALDIARYLDREKIQFEKRHYKKNYHKKNYYKKFNGFKKEG